jgi:TonB family protein
VGELRGANLFPRAALESFAPVPARDAARHAGGGGVARDAERAPPTSLADELAAANTRAGRVAPVWRDVERDLTRSFKPPLAVVHDVPDGAGARVADRLRSLLQQNLAAWARGEDGARHPVEPGATITEQPMGRSIDPSQQTFFGVPEGANLRAMPLEQQQALAAAAGEPAAWLRVELEIAVDDAGAVAEARVVTPSGRRRFDRYALTAVRERVAQAHQRAMTTRWVVEAGYAVGSVAAITVDLEKLLHPRDALHLPLEARVRTRISLQWARPRGDSR